MSPRWFRPERIIGRAIRHQVGRSIRRSFIRRRARRWIIGGAVLLAFAGTHRAVKLRETDVQKLEKHYNRPIEDLNEDEIQSGMHYYNIQPLTIESDDQKRILENDEQEAGFSSQGEKYCMHCGAILLQNAVFCASCGKKI